MYWCSRDNADGNTIKLLLQQAHKKFPPAIYSPHKEIFPVENSLSIQEIEKKLKIKQTISNSKFMYINMIVTNFTFI